MQHNEVYTFRQEQCTALVFQTECRGCIGGKVRTDVKFPGSEVPSFTLKVILDYYRDFHPFIFRLILVDGVMLSVLRQRSSDYVEVVQIVDDQMIVEPIFDHDSCGIATVCMDDLEEFIMEIHNA